MEDQKTLAIDISHWRNVKWDKIPDEVKVVMIKATEGDYYLDDIMPQHVEGALEAGKIVGLYHFYRTAMNGRKIKPRDQAEYFLHHTQQYWGDVKLRANDWERSHKLKSGEWYNPALGSEINDFFNFHQKLHQSGWQAFTLMYTNLATWQEWKMESWKNAWQGPQWTITNGFIDGLWIAAWGVDKPGRLPRPFQNYWMHQFTANYQMPGIYASNGKPSGVDANWIPKSIEEIRADLRLEKPDKPIPSDDFDLNEILAIYRRGWQARTDSLIEYLQANREGEA
jgi:hypothetical protein